MEEVKRPADPFLEKTAAGEMEVRGGVAEGQLIPPLTGGGGRRGQLVRQVQQGKVYRIIIPTFIIQLFSLFITSDGREAAKVRKLFIISMSSL